MNDTNRSIVVTGARGFIGSCLVSKLNKLGYKNIIIVDDFSDSDLRDKNLEDKTFSKKIEIFEFPKWLEEHATEVDFIFHVGANSSTVEFRKEIFDQYNEDYTKKLFALCTINQIPLVFTSSAATYGDGSLGYSDAHELIPALKPLNAYGASKANVDTWVLEQAETPPLWVSLKPFNVYGPNEYHKGRMASTILHFFNQIQESGQINLFRSHRPEYEDGGQRRDFIYVYDLVNIFVHFLSDDAVSGIYNGGTGTARTFLDIAKTVFSVLGREEKINFIDIPLDIRDKYQYFTEADMSKLRTVAKYSTPTMSLEEGINDYITNYLSSGSYY